MKKIGVLLFLISFILFGCTEDDQASEQDEPNLTAKGSAEKEQVEQDDHAANETASWWEEQDILYELTDPPRELAPMEGQLLLKEGSLSGDAYDFERAKELLDEIPSSADVEIFEQAILKLIRENYREEVETFIHFDSTVDVEIDSPNEELEPPEEEEIAGASSHFAILLDSSGSMNIASDGTTRMELAKDAIADFIELLPANSTVSLRVYGQEGTGDDKDKELSCSSTALLYNGKIDNENFSEALDKVEPAGWTPIASTLQAAEEDIPENASNAIVYVVSDGIETCDGDPVKAAEDLTSKGVQPIINIIGFQVDDEAQDLLEKVAEAGRGEFTYAGSKQDLDDFWKEEYERLQGAWKMWQEEGMKRANELSAKLMERANETGQSIMGKSSQEWERAQELIDYVKEIHPEETSTSSKLWNLLYKRSTDIWSYGYQNQTRNWRESYENGVDAWRYFYQTGNEKWTEYYNKKN